MSSSETLTSAINAVVEGRDLSREESAEAMRALMSGEASPAQVAALLVALRMKGETVEEITGFAETMRAFATHVPAARRPLVDTCGTGGDASGTFNISTTAAFVVAGAGYAVAKHGNRSASSQSGSADVLEALGVNLDLSPEAVGQCIDEVGIGFLFARSLHSSMKHVAPIRAELKLRTVFNLLGPLTNPAGADAQVIGVYDRERIGDMARVLANLGTQRAYVVAGADGLDEISVCDETFVAEVRDGEVSEYTISPVDFGFEESDPADLAGGSPEDNAAITRGILSGEVKGAKRDITLANAAAAIRAANDPRGWKKAVGLAEESIDSGAALEKLEKLIAASRAV